MSRTKTIPTTVFPENHSPPEDASPEASLYDPSNPDSLHAVLDPLISDSISGIPPRLLHMTERELRKTVKPDETLCRLKLSFWDEYEKAISKAKRIKVSEVCRGVCTRDYFYEVVMRDPKMIAWVMTPPLDYMIAQREILQLGISRLRSLVKASWWDVTIKRDKHGNETVTKKANAAVMGQVLKAVELLQNRVHGAVLQRHAIEQKSLNLNLNREASELDLLEGSSLADLEKLEAKLDRMQEKLAPGSPEVIDAEEEEGEE